MTFIAADAVTHSIQPYLKYEGKGAFPLCRAVSSSRWPCPSN